MRRGHEDASSSVLEQIGAINMDTPSARNMAPTLRLTRRHKRIISLLIAYPLTFGLSVLFCVPFLWMVSLSLKTAPDLVRMPPRWIPDPIDWSNYAEAMTFWPFAIFFKNTVFMTVLNIIGTVMSSSWVAYGFSRLEFKGRNVFFILVLSTMMLPSQVTLIPQYIIFQKLGWIDSFRPLIVPSFFGSAFNVFLLRQFFLSVPLELDEAALVDGASHPMIYWRIIMPLSIPVLVTITAFAFISNWNMFFGPLIYLKTQRKMVVAVALALFGGTESVYGYPDLLMAASVVSVLPVVAVFLAAQKYFVRGITMTGIKG